MVIHDIVLCGVQNVTGCHSDRTPSRRKEETLAGDALLEENYSYNKMIIVSTVFIAK